MFVTHGKTVVVRPIEEFKQLILNSDDVKEVIAQVTRERAINLRGNFSLVPNEEKIYKQVCKEADAMVVRIMSTLNNSMLKYFA